MSEGLTREQAEIEINVKLGELQRAIYPRPGLYTDGKYKGRVKPLVLQNLRDSPSTHVVAGGVFQDQEMRWMTDDEYAKQMGGDDNA